MIVPFITVNRVEKGTFRKDSERGQVVKEACPSLHTRTGCRGGAHSRPGWHTPPLGARGQEMITKSEAVGSAT